MIVEVAQQPAYLIHRQDYRESSLLLDVFSFDFGMLRLVAKGAKRSKIFPNSILQPFQPLLLGWKGHSDLKNLVSAESVKRLPLLKGEQLYCGFYINELMQKLVHACEPFPALFLNYAEALFRLSANEQVEPELRRFELTLLSSLGILPDLEVDAHTSLPIDEQLSYQWVADVGFISELIFASAIEQRTGYAIQPVDTHQFKGSELLGIAVREFDRVSVLNASKKLSRLLINQQLNGRTLRSRDLIILARKSNVSRNRKHLS